MGHNGKLSASAKVGASVSATIGVVFFCFCVVVFCKLLIYSVLCFWCCAVMGHNGKLSKRELR
jgi:hypothetical protein